MKKNFKEVPFDAEKLLRRVTNYAEGKARVTRRILKIHESVDKEASIPRDKQEDLRRAVVIGIRSAEAGEIHDISDSLKQEIKVLGHLRGTSRGALMGVNRWIDPSRIAAVIRADRDAR